MTMTVPPEPEPVFNAYRKENHPEIGEPPYWDSDLDLDELEPDETFTGWSALSDFLDEHDGEYVWNESNLDNAPEIPVCSNADCEKVTRTWSKERLKHIRSMHHIGTGH